MSGLVETLIILSIISLFGFINDKNKPKKYHYENRIVIVYGKYQCPTYCKTDHHHYVYYDRTVVGHNQMYIDSSKIGERYKFNRKIKYNFQK